MNLADALSAKHYSIGTAIIHQGDPADGMYFVETGEVSVTVVGNDGSERQVSKFGSVWQNIIYIISIIFSFNIIKFTFRCNIFFFKSFNTIFI